MSEDLPKEKQAGKREAFVEIMAKNFAKLPEIDRAVYTYGSVYLAGNSSLVGLISNSLYRRALNVTQARFISMVPVTAVPFMTTYALYNMAVSNPLLSGHVNCPTCVFLRGATVGGLGAAVYPILLGLPLNFILAVRHSTTPMPENGNLVRHWLDVSRPVFRRMRMAVLLQALFGTYLASRDFETYCKLVQLVVGSSPDKGDKQWEN